MKVSGTILTPDTTRTAMRALFVLAVSMVSTCLHEQRVEDSADYALPSAG